MQVVRQMTVDIKQNVAILTFEDHMFVPDFLKKCLAHGVIRSLELFGRPKVTNRNGAPQIRGEVKAADIRLKTGRYKKWV